MITGAILKFVFSIYTHYLPDTSMNWKVYGNEKPKSWSLLCFAYTCGMPDFFFANRISTVNEIIEEVYESE